MFGDFILSISRRTGAIVRLKDMNGREWCDEKHTLALFQYDVYSKKNYDKWTFILSITSRYLKEYFIVWNEWGPQDFGKPHLEEVHNLSASVEKEMECDS